MGIWKITYNSINWSTFGDLPFIRLDYKIGTGDWIPITTKYNNESVYKYAFPDLGSKEYCLRVSSVDHPEIFAVSNQFTVIGGDGNLPPVIDAPDTIDVVENKKTVCNVYARDPNGDSTHLTFTALPNWITLTNDTTLSITASGADNGYKLTMYAEDSHNGKDTAVMVIRVNQAVGNRIFTNSEPDAQSNDKKQLIFLKALNYSIAVPDGKILSTDVFDFTGRLINCQAIVKNRSGLSSVIVQIKYQDKVFRKIVVVHK